MARQAKSQTDPVCGMTVDSNQSSYKCAYHQKEYCFCCQQCMDKFKKNPTQFAKE